jgi:hypothetical protein
LYLIITHLTKIQDPSSKRLKKNRYRIQRWHEALDKPKCPHPHSPYPQRRRRRRQSSNVTTSYPAAPNSCVGLKPETMGFLRITACARQRVMAEGFTEHKDLC